VCEGTCRRRWAIVRSRSCDPVRFPSGREAGGSNL
jgi:hypothetical protein